MADPNLPAPRVPGSDADETLRASHLSSLGGIRDALARDFADEVFAHRLAAARKGIDVVVAAIDALFTSDRAGLAEETTRLLGGKAAAETAGYTPDDVNVVSVVGDKEEKAPGLPDPNEKVEVLGTDPNPLSEAAPDNMTTDPEVNPRLLEGSKTSVGQQSEVGQHATGEPGQD